MSISQQPPSSVGLGYTAEDAANKDTDTALAANSDVKYPSQKAVKAYIDQLIAATDAMVFKGVIDCSANPNYPAADRGHTYRVSVAGKIGGASGPNVEVGDLLLCLTDGTAAGTQAAVGANWSIAQTNIDGAVVGPASATDNRLALFDGATGKLIKDSGTLFADLYRAGGTDVPVADGGTGASSAASALTNLGAAGAPASGTHASRPAAGTAGRFYYETDTGVTYFDNGSAWVPISMGKVVKTGAETVNNNTLQDDDHLFFPIEASETWFAEVFLLITAANATMDFKGAFTAPSGTVRHGVEGGLATNMGGWTTTAVGNAPLAIAVGGTEVGVATGAFTMGAVFGAIIANGATPGTAKFRWAQNTTDAGNLTVEANSFMRLQRLV